MCVPGMVVVEMYLYQNYWTRGIMRVLSCICITINVWCLYLRVNIWNVYVVSTALVGTLAYRFSIVILHIKLYIWRSQYLFIIICLKFCISSFIFKKPIYVYCPMLKNKLRWCFRDHKCGDIKWHSPDIQIWMASKVFSTEPWEQGAFQKHFWAVKSKNS